jgi:hypothetical protein
VSCVDLPTEFVALAGVNGLSDLSVLRELLLIIGNANDLSRLEDEAFRSKLEVGIYIDDQGEEILRFTLPAFLTGGTSVGA